LQILVIPRGDCVRRRHAFPDSHAFLFVTHNIWEVQEKQNGGRSISAYDDGIDLPIYSIRILDLHMAADATATIPAPRKLSRSSVTVKHPPAARPSAPRQCPDCRYSLHGLRYISPPERHKFHGRAAIPPFDGAR
jgi:hypothetical protein